MNWQEACHLSPVGRAYRKADNGSIVRDIGGGAVRVMYLNGQQHIRDARAEEVEGFLDWEPVDY